MERKVGALRDRYIVCAYGRVGRAMAREFEAQEVSFVVIDVKEELEEQMRSDGVLFLIGDPASEAVLRLAGVERARHCPQPEQSRRRPARPGRPRRRPPPVRARPGHLRGAPGRRPPRHRASLNNLAGVLRDQGDLDGARPLYERARAIREVRLGADHPDTVRSRERLAAVVAELDNQK
jgi:hypothetical protein